MSHWNHRIVRDGRRIGIAEVYYGLDDDDDHHPSAYCYVGLDWRTWADFIRHPSWLVTLLTKKRRILDWNNR